MKTHSREVTERYNDHFILADFIYSDSIVRRGFENGFNMTEKCYGEGAVLADLLGEIAEEYGHLSINYGYISPDVSKKTVRWRKPEDPSYHRWDDGAAADFIAHDWVSPRKNNKNVWQCADGPETSPIMLAREIAANHEFSRMITYSESPSICVATKYSETKNGVSRRAFYENRYEGVEFAKPRYIRHTRTPTREDVEETIEEHGWVGRGYPSYHGKGKHQYHHIRVGKYLTLLDCLRSPGRLMEGLHNRPPSSQNQIRNFMKVGFAMSRFMEWYYQCIGVGSLSVYSGHRGSSVGCVSRIAHISEDWGKGEGSMIFLAPLDAQEELDTELQHSGMDDYHVTTCVVEGSLYIRVTWKKL